MGETFFTMKSEVVGRPSVVGNQFVQICKTRRFTIQNILVNFHKFCILFFKFITFMLYYHYHYARGCAQNTGNNFGFNFWKRLEQRWRSISQSHRKSNRWRNLGFILRAWTLEQSKQRTHNLQRKKSWSKHWHLSQSICLLFSKTEKERRLWNICNSRPQ